jgi:hypothetical protein
MMNSRGLTVVAVAVVVVVVVVDMSTFISRLVSSQSVKWGS